jgi:hypothetical protein
MLGRRLVDVPPELLREYYAGSRRLYKHPSIVGDDSTVDVTDRPTTRHADGRLRANSAN